MSEQIEHDQHRFAQEQFLEQRLRDLPMPELLTVYLSENRDTNRRSVFCALVPSGKVPSCLEKTSWDFSIGNGMPGALQYWEGDEKRTEYLRFGDDDGIEPLVLYRDFHGVRESYLEISEEFRTFHNLYHDPKCNRFFKFDDSGNDQLVAVIEKGRVQIRLKEIRQFLAIREMHLALYFDSVEFSTCPLREMGLSESGAGDDVKTDSSVYGLCFGSNSVSSHEKSFSRLLGKRFVSPVAKDKSGFWGYAEEEPRQCVAFIIGVDSNGDDVLNTSDESKLSNYFGANPGEPHYLTPVFFRKTVLDKYYQQPGKYSVEAGSLGCCGLWSMSLDNHLDDHVVAWLGDLGRDLPHEEQLHWRAHNIAPVGRMSNTFFGQQILCQWISSDQLEHVFKQEYRDLATASEELLGWHFLLPLAKDDEHFLQALRIPATDEQKEFDELILGLTKVIVDSINEKEINKFIPKDEVASLKGSITRLEKSWAHCSVTDAGDHVRFLRDLQELRSSGAAHRKGSNYRKNTEKLGIEAQPLRDVFRGLLQKGLEFLRFAKTTLAQLNANSSASPGPLS